MLRVLLFMVVVSLFFLILECLLLSLGQDVKLLMNFVFVTIYNALSIKRIFVEVIGVKICLINLLSYCEIILGKVLKKIINKGSLAFVLFK